MSCEICGRELQQEGLCRYHLEAKINLRSAYEGWERASGVNWEQYLDELEQIEETGRWVLDVIEHVRQRDGLVGEM